jgi:hypothetical protein
MPAIRFVTRPRDRWLILSAFALVMFLVWLGVWLRFLPPRPRATVYIGCQGDVEAMSEDGSKVVISRCNSHGERPELLLWEPASNSDPRPLQGTGSGDVIHLNVDKEIAVVREPMEPKGDTVTVLNMLSGQKLGSVKWSKSGGFSSWGVSPDSRWLAIGCQVENETSVSVFNLESMDLRLFLRGQSWNPVVFSPDGNWLATHDGNSEITIWGLATDQPITKLNYPGAVESLVFARNGTALVATGATGWTSYPRVRTRTGKVWEIPSGHERDPATAAEVGIVSPDGRRTITVDDGGGSVYARVQEVNTLWDSGLQEVGSTEGADSHEALSWVAHGRLVAVRANFEDPSSSWLRELIPSEPNSNGSLKLLDPERFRFVASIPLEGNPYFSGDGSVMAARYAYDRVAVYDLPPPRPYLLLMTFAGLPTLLFTLLLYWRLVK